jgi:uncharacterized membrane protein YkvA (DUF1232 family)
MTRDVMPAKNTSFAESMTAELMDFIQSQARALSRADLEPLIVDLPRLRALLTEVAPRSPSLTEQCEFLALVVENESAKLNGDSIPQHVAEAAFALLYLQRATDLIPDLIPGLGLLDDAMIVNMVLRRNEHAFRSYSHASRLSWSAAACNIEELLSVVSPLRLSSVCRTARSESQRGLSELTS